MLGALASLAGALAIGLITAQAWRRNLHRWLPSALAWQAEPPDPNQPLHLYFCCADHFEPLWATQEQTVALERVRRWFDEYPRLVSTFRDSEGRLPQHTFFFPAEEYHPLYLEMLSRLCAAGYGDVEVHLHHDNDSSQHFVDSVETFIEQLQGHGFLQNRPARHRFGFIHGNWCLDNSRRDGRWCGLNNEIELLCQLGCYADFTFPSAPSETQPRMVNCIYYSRDDPARPGSHVLGRPAQVGVLPEADELCLITGPLGLAFTPRKYGLLPRIENGNVGGVLPLDERRCRRWLRLGARVRGAPNHVFVKVHTHGTQERLYAQVLGEQAREMYRHLAGLQADGLRLHFVTAYEMWRKIRSLEQGQV